MGSFRPVGGGGRGQVGEGPARLPAVVTRVRRSNDAQEAGGSLTADRCSLSSPHVRSVALGGPARRCEPGPTGPSAHEASFCLLFHVNLHPVNCGLSTTRERLSRVSEGVKVVCTQGWPQGIHTCQASRCCAREAPICSGQCRVGRTLVSSTVC